MTQTPKRSFSTFMRERVGPNWVVTRRTPRVVRQYGDDVVCLSLKLYKALEAEFEGSDPIKRLHDAAPDLLAAAKIVLEGLNARIDSAPKNAVPLFAGIAALHNAINKAERHP